MNVNSATARLLLGVGLAAALALPASAQESESDRRARQLEVFERLLSETVQLHLSREIETLQMKQNIVIEEGADVVVTLDAAPVVRLGQLHGAHGTYVAGHGLVFTIESPPVAVMPQPLALRLAEPFGVYEFRDAEGNVQWAGRVVEFRTRMMEESLRELETLLERERAGDANPERTAGLLQEIEKLRESLATLQAKVAPADAPPAPEAPVAPEQATADAEAALAEAKAAQAEREQVEAAGIGEGHVRRRVAPGGFEFYRAVVAEQRGLGEEVAKHRHRVATAVREACIEALSQYGSVIKGLGDDDRITVMVFPSDDWGRRAASSSSEEVISVRYADIREYDAGRIDLDGFRARVTVNDRLGNPIATEQQ